MKTNKKCDLHVHTNFSYDNPRDNTMEQNVVSAIHKGIDILCFTEHIECGNINTFVDYPFEIRKREFDRLAQKYDGQIKLLLGFEMGSPHRHPRELAFLRSLEPDMIIGSVHHPTDYHNINYHMSSKDYEKLYEQEVRKMVECGGFDVLGHADMLKKYHHHYKPDLDFLAETLKICVQNDIVPELNTSPLRQMPIGPHSQESMISAQMARVYAEFGGKYVTISSDSHDYKTIGSHFEETYDAICDVLSLCYFEKGKLVELQ